MYKTAFGHETVATDNDKCRDGIIHLVCNVLLVMSQQPLASASFFFNMVWEDSNVIIISEPRKQDSKNLYFFKY